MWFGELNTSEADGCVLAHSVKIGTKRVAKGTQLDQPLITSLLKEGHSTVVVARIAADDVAENTAALAIAEAIAGDGLRIDKAHTGRVNIFAAEDGLLCFDRQSVIDLNSIDESLTFATLKENSMVLKGRMVATSKIITYAVQNSVVQQALEVVQAHPLHVSALRSQTGVLIQTRLPTIKESTLDKSYRVTQERLQSRYAQLNAEFRCDHNVESLVRELGNPDVLAANWILIAGASAISDRNDVIPAAIVAAGGTVDRYGIPVDPGNLLLLGRLGHSTVLGLPGCARSPKYNGLDQILDRLACDVPITNDWLNGLSVGGLLDEDLARPQPRRAPALELNKKAAQNTEIETNSKIKNTKVAGNNVAAETLAADNGTVKNTGEWPRPSALLRAGTDKENSVHKDRQLPTVAGLMLAAGSSTRAGAINKLLVEMNGKPMVRVIAESLLQSQVDSVQVVTGHEHERVEVALDGLDIPGHYCPSYMMGMAHSLSLGISRLPACDAVLVCLSDMPHITPALIDFLIESVGLQAAEVIAVPVFQGRRGNPVMVGKAFFDTLLQHDGDTGARFLMKQYPDRVLEIEVSDSSVVTDYDTVEALNELSG